MLPRNPALGLGLVTLGATLFIVNAGVSRVALRAGVDPVMLTTVRVTGTFVVLALAAALFRRSALRPPPGRLRWFVVAHGLVGVAALQWAYFVAIDRLPVGMALLLEFQAPFLVAVWARVVQKEAVRRRMWVGLALAMAGLAGVTGVWKGAVFDPVGVAAALGAAVCLATYFLIGEHGVGSLDPLQVIVWSFLTGSVALNAVSPVAGFDVRVLGDDVSLLGTLSALSAPVWLVLAWIVVLGTVVPFGVELLALRHLSATKVTMVAMLEPVGVSVLGWVWFLERLDTVGIVGGAAVVAGIVLAQTARRAHVQVEPAVPT